MTQTKQIGAYTLHAGRSGCWVGVSGPREDHALIDLMQGGLTAGEYVAHIEQRLRDAKKVEALLGEPVA